VGTLLHMWICFTSIPGGAAYGWDDDSRDWP